MLVKRKTNRKVIHYPDGSTLLTIPSPTFKDDRKPVGMVWRPAKGEPPELPVDQPRPVKLPKSPAQPKARKRKALTDAEKRTHKIRAMLCVYGDNQRPSLDDYGNLVNDKVAPPPKCRRHNHKTMKESLACRHSIAGKRSCRGVVSAEDSNLWNTRHKKPTLTRTA